MTLSFSTLSELVLVYHELVCAIAKQPSLKLKSQPKQLFFGKSFPFSGQNKIICHYGFWSKSASQYLPLGGLESLQIIFSSSEIIYTTHFGNGFLPGWPDVFVNKSPKKLPNHVFVRFTIQNYFVVFLFDFMLIFNGTGHSFYSFFYIKKEI
jgi:hypothetical protein